LFTELVLTRSIIPLGLYRSPTVHNCHSPYVITNPPGFTILNRHDKIYVLVGEEDMGHLTARKSVFL
jgi:hypothetical protein